MPRRKTPITGHILAHKIALDPTVEQSAYLMRAAGTARFAWNWALRRWHEEYALYKEYRCGPKPSAFALLKELNSIKDIEFPWMNEVSSVPRTRAILNLGDAWAKFFSKLKKERKAGSKKSNGRRIGSPRFKKKNESSTSFTAAAATEQFIISGKRIKLPRIGWIKMRENLRFEGRPLSATVSLHGGRWFVSVNVETFPEQKPLPKAVVGIDLGIKRLASFSDGAYVDNPKHLSASLKRLARLQRLLRTPRKDGSGKKVCKTRGSLGYRRTQARIAKLHARIANQRSDTLHNLTTHITKHYGTVAIEDLNVRGMTSNRKLARAVSDVGMYEFRRQLAYKATMRGTRVVLADRWYPSSKTCSACGVVNSGLTLSDREWTCDSCGTFHDRDFNAAMNLRSLAVMHTVTACGEKDRCTGVEPGVSQLDEAGINSHLPGFQHENTKEVRALSHTQCGSPANVG